MTQKEEIMAKFGYEAISNFVDGVAIAKAKYPKNPEIFHHFHIGENGEPLYDPKYCFDKLGHFYNGWARFQQWASWGFINPQGQILKDPDEKQGDQWEWRNRQFTQAGEFQNGEARVTNVYGYVFTIDVNGLLKREIRKGCGRECHLELSLLS